MSQVYLTQLVSPLELATATATATTTTSDEPIISYEYPLLQELLAHLPLYIIRVVDKAIALLLELLRRAYTIYQLQQQYWRHPLLEEELV